VTEWALADDCARVRPVLRAIEAERSHLARLTPERRRELLTLARPGRQARAPRCHENGEGFRRAKREARRVHDRKLMDQAGCAYSALSGVSAALARRPKPDGTQRGPRSTGRELRNCQKKPFALARTV